jgi:hypothetical protein
VNASVLTGLVVLVALLVPSTGAEGPLDLDQYRWRQRVLVLSAFADDSRPVAIPAKSSVAQSSFRKRISPTDQAGRPWTRNSSSRLVASPPGQFVAFPNRLIQTLKIPRAAMTWPTRPAVLMSTPPDSGQCLARSMARNATSVPANALAKVMASSGMAAGILPR